MSEPLVIVSGPAGSGKTTALIDRAKSAQGVLVMSPRVASCERIRSELRGDDCSPVMTVEDLAFAILAQAQHEGGGIPVQAIDEVEASIIFARAAEPLFQMEWAEFIEARIDPDVPGMRAPQRFLEAAFRLIRKLRDAQMSPATFLTTALKGATQFYARPPNLAHPDLLYYTKDNYRDSLDVDAAELQRQHRREVDLAKILEQLYRSYLDLTASCQQFTGSDAVAQATEILAADSGLRAYFNERYRTILLDDAQELRLGELALLEALRGADLRGVVLYADAASAVGTFSGARPDRVFALKAERIEMETAYRCAPVIERAARHLSGAEALQSSLVEGRLLLFRASTQKAEAAFVAEHVVALLNAGTPASEIALIFRSVANVQFYESALLDRNVDVQVTGDLNIFTVPDVLDAMALLWNIQDPFAHDWVLRTLAGPAWSLSDASLVILCTEPESGQGLLFEDLPQPEANRRWDRKRDVRLGWNVVRGDQDDALSATARERVQTFRKLREGWTQDVVRLRLVELATKVFQEGLARVGAPDSARSRSQERNIQRLLARIEEFSRTAPDGTLRDFLDYAAARMASSFEACEEHTNDSIVRIVSVPAAMGGEFDHVFLPNARAGSFPRYYVPDAFLFSPSLGMIAKENAGEARTARTAKFTYYMFRAKTRESYNREERRAFVYAMRRARKSVTVTASERATRGMTSPEFLSELQAAHLPGSTDLSDQWRPANLRVAAGWP